MGYKNTATGENIPKGYRKASIQNFTPEQMELLNQSMSQVGPDSFLSKLAGGDQSMFDEMEAPAMRQFSGLQGNIASRFSGMGMGGQKSSGFQNTMNQASSDFAQDLHSQRMNMRMKALEELMSFSDRLMSQRPYENGLVQKQQKQSSGWGGLAGAGLGAVGGFFAGGPAGAYQGANLGYQVGSSF